MGTHCRSIPSSTMPTVLSSIALAGSLSLTAALFVPRELQVVTTFIDEEGACRTAENTIGTFRLLQGVTRAACEAECTRDPECVAYEHNRRNQCEIHTETITRTARVRGDVICSFKFVEPEIVFCAGDVFQCPGVADVTVSRDPTNNCEFRVEECPQVQPEPEIVFCAGDVFQCPGVAGVTVSRDPTNNCEFRVEECPQVQPQCDPSSLCLAQETCVDGRLYRTSCGPRNCDTPIADSCDRPVPDPVFIEVSQGTCRSNNLQPLFDAAECRRAFAQLNLNIRRDFSGSNFNDVVDGCSVRGRDQLFFNDRGTCDLVNGASNRLFRDCECSDLNPCLCAARLD